MQIEDKNNHRLSRNLPSVTLGVADDIIYNRSLSCAYAYEKQYSVITSPASFFKAGRQDSVMDVLVTPKEVLYNLNI
jgi:hypothetical protein